MKIQKLLLLASSMLLLTSCGKNSSSGNGNGGGDSEKSDSSDTTGETTGDDNQIETLGIGDYFVAEAFEADDPEYASAVAMFIHPAIRFAADYFELSLVYNIGSKTKVVFAGSFTYTNKNLVLDIQSKRINGAEQTVPYIPEISIKGDKFFFQLSIDQGGGQVKKFAHTTLSRASNAFYSIDGQYRFYEIDPKTSMEAETISHETKIFAASEAKVTDDAISFTMFRQDSMIVYETVRSSSTQIKVDRMEFRDYDGFSLYNQTPSGDVYFTYELSEGVLKIDGSGAYWVVYHTK